MPLISFLRTILSLLSSMLLGVDTANRWLQPTLNLLRSITLRVLWSKLPKLILQFIRNSLANTEFKDSQLLNFSLEELQLIIREKELWMPCHLSLRKSQTSKSHSLRTKLMLRLSLPRNFLYSLLFLRRIKRIRKFSPVFVPTMRLLTVPLPQTRLPLRLSWVEMLD